MNVWTTFAVPGYFGWYMLLATFVITLRATIAWRRTEPLYRFKWLLGMSLIPLLFGVIATSINNNEVDRMAKYFKHPNTTLEIAKVSGKIAHPLYLGIVGTVIAAAVSGVGLLQVARQPIATAKS